MPELTHTRQVVAFTLAGEQYALPIEQIQEIIRYTEPRSIVSTESWTRGVLSLRGMIIPIYDLAGRMSLSSQITEDTKIVIVDAGSRLVGVIVDGVDEVLTVDDQQIEAVPSADTSMFESVARIEDRLVVLLDPAAIFPAEPVEA